MSLVDPNHIVGARERHGANYRLKARKHDGKLVMWMMMKNPKPSKDDRICDTCLRTLFDTETFCPRCKKT